MLRYPCLLLYVYVLSSHIRAFGADVTSVRTWSRQNLSVLSNFYDVSITCKKLCNGNTNGWDPNLNYKSLKYIFPSKKRNGYKTSDSIRICRIVVLNNTGTTVLKHVECNNKQNFTCKCNNVPALNEMKKREITYSYLYLKDNVLGKVQEIIFGPSVCHSLPRLHQMNYQLTSRVVGGNSAIYGSQPWQVEISKFTDGHYKHHCSGAILTPLHVITAAHCFQKQWKLRDFRVTTGDHNLAIKDDYEDSYEIDKVVLHPQSTGNRYDNDVAILKIKSSKKNGIVYGTHVQPACLPNHDTPHNPGTNCIVSGWGKTEENSNTTNSNILKSANVQLLPTIRCQELYENYTSISEGMLCAGHWEGGIDSCNGDSGGPLICNVTNKSLLLGLVSWGEGCAQPNRPGVYVHVQHYLKWIYQTIGESD